MISCIKKKIKNRFNECIEESFFRSMIIISLAGCMVALCLDMFSITGNIYTVWADVFFITVLLITLCLFKTLNFQKITVVSIFLMDISIIARELLTTGFFHVTAMLLIALGFISSLIMKGAAKNCLRSLIAASLILVLFKGYGEVAMLILIRQSISYIIVFLIVTVSTGILKNRYERNQQRLKKLVQLLHQKNNKILEQHTHLLKSYNQLTQLNTNLEQIVKQKTYRIEQKNKQLAEIAYENAHRVRGPLARILGLLQLSTLDPKNNDFYLTKINYEATEMDDIIHRIGRSIELNILD